MPSPAAPKATAPRHLPADGGIFVGSQSPRRNGSLVSRARRRQAAVEEPGADSARETAIDEGVTVISRTPTRAAAPQAWTPPPEPAAPPAPGWGSATRTGIPYAGEEPAPGQMVVLEGDDVEAWVRERLYGGRLPPR
ncbi:MAG TPA: hypothetical protein VG294_06250 [Solirubrobacteraceae bacterium]|nr:hypothetical protein [Solirubrobacteraceae bacterium]